MSEPFVGEIRMFGGSFAPRGWALCDGQLLQVSQNDALFSLFGTIYGGDGRTTFGLPDLRGRLPVHMGSGPGLTPRPIGQKSGQENVTLNTNELPSHTHTYQASEDIGDEPLGSTKVLSESAGITLYRAATPNVPMNANAITAVGGSGQHTNVMPFQCVTFIIALFGIYPSRN
jgi:microcystin-dependent protein